MPVHIAQREGFKRVMAVAVGAFRPAVLSELKTVSKIMYRSLEVVFDIIDQRCKPAADLIIHASNGSTSLEFARKRELIALGERAVEESERAVDAFFGSGIAAYAARKRYREGGIKTGADYAEATRA
jgi:NTE family protein